MMRMLLARWGLARPPFTRAALEVQGMLRDLETHLIKAKDGPGLVLAARLHDRLNHFATVEAPPGAVDLAPLSATPKPPRPPQ